MNTPRQLAVNCTAKKIAYRQTREGVVISFVLHPQDIPDKIATDPIGTTYVIALVEVDDATDQPKGGDAHDKLRTRQVDTAPRSQASPEGGARKSWDELSPAQQAGILCADKSFWLYIGAINENDARNEVCRLCGVESRKEIISSTKPARLWRDLVARYRAWQHEPEVVG